MLKFSYRNKKIKLLAERLGYSNRQVVAFDLPAGYTCPMADKCKAYANRITGKIIDGENMVFRCYAASGESLFKNTRFARWHNYELLRCNEDNMHNIIAQSLPKDVKVVRVHSSGDFFSYDYFQAWCTVAKNNPDVIFFGYTKILPYVTANKPDNFKLVYSYGGKLDQFVTDNVPTCYVIGNEKDSVYPVACEIDKTDDFDFIMKQVSFSLVVHGVQPSKVKSH